MKYIIMLIIFATLITGCGTTTALIDFGPQNLNSVTYNNNPVNVGDRFNVGDILLDNISQVQMVVLPFKWSTLQNSPCSQGWTNEGYIEIVQDNMSGGTGAEIHFNNASLGVVAPAGVTVVKLAFKFGEYGGNINLIENGILYNEDDFQGISIPPPPAYMVSSYPQGTISFSSAAGMGQFAYVFPCPNSLPSQYTAVIGGGQELWVDDIEFTFK